MKIVVYGLTITSSWGNGHATTYRALLSALAGRHHRIEFIEKDVEWYRSNRDLPNPEFCSVHLYDSWESSAGALLELSEDADAIIIGSYFPDAVAATSRLLEQARCPVLFYDIDTPITLQRLRSEGVTEYLNPALIPSYAAYLSFTGGPALRELEQNFGALRAIPFFCSVDPDLYRPLPVREEFRCDLSYLGTYAKDRQPKLERLLDGAASLLPQKDFLVAGSQYPEPISWSPNVRRIIHVSPPDHPAFFSSSRFTLNLTREAMVSAGYSPSVRLFEASACGAAIVSDSWPGLDEFLTPGEEILLPTDAADVIDILEHVSDAERNRIGGRARERILAEHTAGHRAVEFERIIAECH
ncbi:MAG TPA: glycosyltransferase [Acidobacteriaceae bacterium]|nr:glycosyltransferase [Acidobacteriaceae bacterium]